MAYEEKALVSAAPPHNVILEGRRKLSVSGVRDVARFDEGEIAMETVAGELIVRGEGLHIGRLSLDTGELSVEGHVTELCYEESAPAGGFWSRLFH